MLFNPRINGETVFDVRKLGAITTRVRKSKKKRKEEEFCRGGKIKELKIDRDRCIRLLQKKKWKKKKRKMDLW